MSHYRVSTLGVFCALVFLSVPAFAQGTNAVESDGSKHTIELSARARSYERVEGANALKPIEWLEAGAEIVVVKEGKTWTAIRTRGKTVYVKTAELQTRPKTPAVEKHDADAKAEVDKLREMQTGLGASAPVSSAKLDASSGKVKLVVYPVKRAAEIEERQASLISEALLWELRKLDGVTATGMAEVSAMLSLEEQKQLTGCSDDSCLAEIAGALGVDLIIIPEAGMLGGSKILTFKRINIRTVQVEKAVTKRMVGGTGEEYLESIGPAVAEMFPERKLRDGMKSGVPSELVKRYNPPPLPKWVFASTMVTAGGLAIAGGIYSMRQADSEKQFKELDTRAQNGEVVAGNLLTEAEEDALSHSTMARIFYISAGGMAVASGVIALFTDWTGEPDLVEIYGRPITLGMEAVPGGAMLTLGAW